MRPLLVGTVGVAIVICLAGLQYSSPSIAQDSPPFAGVGHGNLYDASGAVVKLTPERIAQAQRWYSDHLRRFLPAADRRAVEMEERAMRRGARFSKQEQVLANQRVLDAIASRLPADFADHQMRGVVALLGYRVRSDVADRQRPIVLRPDFTDRLARLRVLPRAMGNPAMLVTTNSGQAYIDECRNNRVPIPPPINQMDPAGTSGWKIEGELPANLQFIERTPAEVRVFTSADGMCIALPRYRTGTNKTVVFLDGVICQSRVTSKVCFWDNQMNGAGFDFGANERIPIGVPDTSIDPAGRYQAGGNELLGGSGGVCTGCHAGENAYIVHPDVTLIAVTPGTSNVVWGTMASRYPMFPPQRYDPIVPAAWPQNRFSHNLAYVPGSCSGCHRQGGTGGRLPHLSTELRTGANYCGSVLRPAVAGFTGLTGTMPQGAGGSLANDPDVNDFRGDCDDAPTAGPADRGDPHITTTNGISYDFHGAGEFVALRNQNSGFEVQTRQSPVLTGFRAGANAHTGLSGCVSVNTAAAVRVGKHRISLQPGDKSGRERPVLRIDGRPERLANGKIGLPGGGVITRTANGNGFDVRSPEGDRVVITPGFWENQGVWYLDVDVTGTAAREGVMGRIRPGHWLPMAPDGTSFGARPPALLDRHQALNIKFAEAWRVTAANSLFDYDPGTSTDSFTDRDWPSPPGGMCSSSTAPAIATVRERPNPAIVRKAKAICAELPLAEARKQCLYDVAVMQDVKVAENYRQSIANRLTP
jgi:hypothetical protein